MNFLLEAYRVPRKHLLALGGGEVVETTSGKCLIGCRRLSSPLLADLDCIVRLRSAFQHSSLGIHEQWALNDRGFQMLSDREHAPHWWDIPYA